MKISIIDEIVEQLETMPLHLQTQVLEFARTLVKTEIKGTSGQNLLHFAGSIPASELKLMYESIHLDCEQIDSY